ncbi:MAG: hypothetical protein M3R63_15145 [Actinomycetota bacterium]|nr:hypothetical protein [Actinomycetota bacterium]
MTPAAVLLRSLNTISVTCVADGKAHEITDYAMAAGHAARAGNYCALCGHRVTPAPLVEPSGAPCRDCLVTLRAERRPESRHGRNPDRHRHTIPDRGLSWLRGLLHAPMSPTAPPAPSPRRAVGPQPRRDRS